MRKRVRALLLFTVGIGTRAVAADVATPTDPAEARAIKIWKSPRKLPSVISIHSRVQTAKGIADAYGTGFMISDEYALTAGHVVCSEMTGHQEADIIDLYIGGPGASTIAPTGVDCYPSDVDVGMVRVPALNAGRDHLSPGVLDVVESDPFITAFGYGGAQAGRPIKGNVRIAGTGHLSLDADNLVRTDLGASPGDSGAPVLNRDGDVIGVLLAGNAVGETTFVSLPQIVGFLTPENINLPASAPAAPVQQAVIAAPGPNTLSGTVNVQLGRSPDGSWPVPPSRTATDGEVALLVYFGKDVGDPILASTDASGNWRVAAPPSPSVPYSVVFSASAESDQPPEARQYRSNPVSGVLLPSSSPLALTLYARSAFVRVELQKASADQQLLAAGNSLKCIVASSTGQARPSGCSLQQLGDANAIANVADDAFNRAYEASAAADQDISITTQVAFRWLNFRVGIGRPCQGVQVMNGLMGKFQSQTLSGPLVSQVIDTTVRCQSLPDNSSTAMPFRVHGQTRQDASIGFVDRFLASFVPQALSIRPEAAQVMSNILTALENYDNGMPQVRAAAQHIAASSTLRDFTKRFASKYVRGLCSNKISVPGTDGPSIEAFLTSFRRLLSSCST